MSATLPTTEVQALREDLAELKSLLRGTMMNAPLTAEELAARWHIGGLHWRRELVRKCTRLGLRPVDLGHQTKLYRPADILGVEEAATASVRRAGRKEKRGKRKEKSEEWKS